MSLFCSGLWLKDELGNKQFVYPVLVGFIGDISGQSSVLCIGSSHLCDTPDLQYLVPKNELDSVGGEFRKRTESEMLAVWQQAQAIVAAADGNGLINAQKEAKNLLQQYSLAKLPLFDPTAVRGVTNCHQLEFLRDIYPGLSRDKPLIPAPALAGFFQTDAYQLAMPDFLHTIPKGIGDYLINPKNLRGVMYAISKRTGFQKAFARVRKNTNTINYFYFLFVFNLSLLTAVPTARD